MSMEAHLTELQRRHQNLEREIEDAHQSPSMNALEIAALKRKKLHLKDEIKRLMGSALSH